MNIILRGSLTLALFALAGAGVRADDAHPEKKHEAHAKNANTHAAKKAPTVEVKTEHDSGKFDLNTEEGRDKFIKFIEDHGAEHIEQEQSPLAFYADTALWSIVVFVALVFILKKYAWGPMLEGLTKREQTIRQSVEEAQLAREETERVRAQFKAEMDQAFAKIPQLMEEARKQADKLVEEKLAKASAEIQADRDRLLREVKREHEQNLKVEFERLAELATMISGRVLARTLTADDQQRLFQLATDELLASGQREQFVKA